ncbi:alpha/beta hydrolase [Planctomycetaceae bacterium SH139]
MKFRRTVADRLILQPTRHPLKAIDMRRVEIPYFHGHIEAYAGRTEQPLPALDTGSGLDLGPGLDRQASRRLTEPSRGLAVPDFQAQKKPPRLLVLKLPGTAGRAERSTLFPVTLLEHQPAEVWTWNAPGYGGSSGKPTLAGMAHAVLHFYDAVTALRAGEETRIWVCGNSLGCATSLHLAAHRPVDGLVLRNPPPLIELVTARDAWWNLGFGGRLVARGIPREMNAVVSAERVNAGILFIESTADKVVPPDLQQLIREAHVGPQQLLQLAGAEHHTPIDDVYREPLVESLRWLWDQAPRRSASACA